MFDRIKKKSIENLVEGVLEREVEEKIFEHVAQEIESGHRRDGLWAKALVLADGHEAQAKAEYIKLRIQSIQDEQVLASLAAVEDAVKAAEAEELENQKFAAVAVRDFNSLGLNIIYRQKEWSVIGHTGHVFKFKSKQRVELLLRILQKLNNEGYIAKIEKKIGLLDSRLIWSVRTSRGNLRAFVASSLDELVSKAEALPSRDN
ncbi:hypothetical protein OAM79_01335 [Litorivicinus sp.]|nr:hypothetical protein [Litorivicinus sp.]